MKRILTKLNVKIILFFVLICSFVCFGRVRVEAAENEKYNQACRDALQVIKEINQDNKKVYIRDIYNVIDTQGELMGYSKHNR